MCKWCYSIESAVQVFELLVQDGGAMRLGIQPGVGARQFGLTSADRQDAVEVWRIVRRSRSR